MSMFKVFRYVMDKKVAYYVYNFYNELQYINKAIDTNLRKDKNEYKNTEFSSLLQLIDVKQYCSAFTKSLNTIGEVDCNNISVSNKVDLNPTIEYTCLRTSQITVNDQGEPTESNTLVADNYKDCINNEVFSNTVYCNAVASDQINDVVIDNKIKHAYKCSKVPNNKPVAVFDVDSKRDNISSIRTVNNINLFFLTLKQSPDIKYNLKANITQEAICPAIRPKITSGKCVLSGSTSSLQNRGGNIIFTQVDNFSARCDGYYTVRARCDNYYKKTPSWCNVKGSGNKLKWFVFDHGSNVNQKSYNGHISYETPQGSSCEDYINLSSTKYSTPTNTKSQYYYFDTNETSYYSVDKVSITTKLSFSSFVFNQDDLDKYYTKWNNFFTNQKLSKESKNKIENKEFSEGSVTQNVKESSMKYFIYAAIDKDFSEAEMKKDIFVFEQYGDKVIPVGYLANNKNSPLKFNVYTRSAQTGHLSRVARDVTYCEAMSYVGGTVSEYCGCKDVNKNIVTEFEASTECGTLGCDLRAAKPNFKSVWLPSK